MDLLYKKEEKKPWMQRFALFFFKWMSAFLISFTISIFFMALMDYGTWSFLFVFVALQGLLWKMLFKANIVFVMIVDSFFISLIIALKLYVAVGPNI